MFKWCNKEVGFGEGDVFVPSWGFIIPHTRLSPGAISWDGTYSEYMYGCTMIPTIGLPYATRNDRGVRGAVKQLHLTDDINASIEPHFNAFNTKAHGAEILVLKGDAQSRYYAELFVENFADTFPHRRIRCGGVKDVGSGERGYKNLKIAKTKMKVALLTELFFGDNGQDWLSPRTQSDFWKDCLKKF